MYTEHTEVVEFQQSSDRRTGKPIAVAVIRAPLKTSCEIISEKPSNGIVLAEAKAIKNKGVCNELYWTICGIMNLILQAHIAVNRCMLEDRDFALVADL